MENLFKLLSTNPVEGVPSSLICLPSLLSPSFGRGKGYGCFRAVSGVGRLVW